MCDCLHKHLSSLDLLHEASQLAWDPAQARCVVVLVEVDAGSSEGIRPKASSGDGPIDAGAKGYHTVAEYGTRHPNDVAIEWVSHMMGVLDSCQWGPCDALVVTRRNLQQGLPE